MTCTHGDASRLNNRAWFGRYTKGKITQGQYGVITDCVTKAKESCPAGYKYVGSDHWGFNSNLVGKQTLCGLAWQNRGLCARDFPSDAPGDTNVKLACCTGAVGSAWQKNNCSPQYCRNSSSCDTFMESFCSRPENKGKVECSCFQKGLTVKTSLGEIGFTPSCYKLPDNKCGSDPRAYKTNQMQKSQCPSLVLCDVSGNVINVKDSDVKVDITQKCDMRFNPKTGTFEPTTEPTKPGDVTPPPPPPPSPDNGNGNGVPTTPTTGGPFLPVWAYIAGAGAIAVMGLVGLSVVLRKKAMKQQ